MTNLWSAPTRAAWRVIVDTWRWATQPEGPVLVSVQILLLLVLGGLAVLGALTLLWGYYVGFLILG